MCLKMCFYKEQEFHDQYYFPGVTLNPSGTALP
jgi:hypothetical protein